MQKIELMQKQSLPLDIKIEMTKRRIQEFYDSNNGNVYISFSGGKDSTVLLHLVRSIYPNIEAVFVDTGLEYPEIKEFVKTFNNVTVIRPKQSFCSIIKTYGYPVISKNVSRYVNDLQNPTKNNKRTRDIRLGKTNSSVGTLSNKWRYLVNSGIKISDRCCYIMKKQPIYNYEKNGKRPYIGTMASDSKQREMSYLKNGCNSFGSKAKSNPLSFWLEKDIWDYIKLYNLKYCSIYDTGITRTGCMFCMFGIHKEKKINRFQLMSKTHPKLYNYCINKLECGKVLDILKINYKEDKLNKK